MVLAQALNEQRSGNYAAADAAHAALLGALAARATAKRGVSMREAQEAYDSRAEPEQDEDALTPDEAESQAEDEVLATAEPLADWMAKQCACDQGREPVNLLAMRRAEPDLSVDLSDCNSVPVLLAAIMIGYYPEQRAAVARLRTLYLQSERQTVSKRAAVLLGDA